MEERCVYVKETVLSELEREKRGLRWQLARAAKLAESRAADVTACESKVKDLLTIVEMNKSVADRAVKRTHMQESQLQRVVFERDDLQLRLAAHRQRCMERGLRGLEQRIVRRLARETLRTLALRATRSRRLRAAWCRMTQLLSPPRVANAFQKWKHVCAPDAGRVHPSALTTHPTASAAEALATTRFPTEFLYDECFRLRFQRRRERTRVAFFAWKTAWVLGSRKHRLAVHWFGAQLSRRVLRAWRHRVQSTQRLRAALKRVATRSVRQIVRAWSSVARRGAQRRRVLGRVLRSHRRQLLRRALTGLCLRCVERNAVEWAHALTTAHQALEEEKVMFALHQDAALKELHASLAEQEQSTRRFQAAHSRALLLARCHAQLRQRFLTWRAQLTRRRLLASVAKRFHRAQHRMRLCRRHFVAWMRLGVARARVRRCVARATLKRRRALLSRVFEAFAAHVRRANARKRRLRALASRVRRVWLLRSWSRWQQSFLVGEHRVSAELETHELVQRMQQQQLRWQSAFARAEKLRRQLQLQYALRMRDARATRGLGERFRRWAARSWAASLRRRALSRVAERCRTQALRLGVARWRQQALAYERLARTLDARASTRRHQRLRTGLATWRRVVTQRALARWNAQRQRLFFAAWRDARARQRERAAAFCRFLRRRVALGSQAQALHTWRRRSEAAAHREQSRDRLRRELAERAWRHWSAFVTARLRLRCRQGDLVQSRLREQQRLTTQRGEFQCWKLLSQRERRQLGLASLAAARLSACRSRHTQCRLLDRWRQVAIGASQRRRLVLRVLRCTAARATRTKWMRWVRATAQAAAVQTLRGRSLASIDAAVSRVAARHALWRSLRCWSNVTRAASCRRRERDRFAARCRTHTLQWSFRSWRRDFVGLRSAQKAALRRRVDWVRTLALKTAVRRWERVAMLHAVCLQATVSQILVERAQERADEMVGALLTTRALRTVVSAWSRVAQRRTTQRRALRRVLVARTSQLQRGVWKCWRSRTALLRRLERLVQRLQTQRLRAAWLTMRAAQSTERLRARAAFVIAKLWRRHWLRSQWNVWKRRARLETHEAVARSHQQSLALVTTVMGALVHRRHGRHRQRHCFVAWKQRAAAMKRVRGVWGRLIGQREELSLRTRFQDWKVHAGRSRALRSRLTCILSRRLRVATRVAFHRWKCEAIRRLYAGQLETTRMELQSQGVAVAKHVARAMYSTWKHPCLSSCFTQWRIRIRDARHAVKHKLARCLDRRRTRHIVAVLRAWRRFVALQRTVRLLWSNAVAHSHRKLLSAVFVRWRADATTATTLTRGLSRAVDALRRWQLRRGFRQLEASDRDARRRESVKIVVAAQTALQQAKQRHVVKSVALLLRWKQSKSRAHAFALWTAAVAAKQQLRAVVGATRRRHERRALRRLLSAWRRVTKGQRCSRSRVRKLRVAWTQRRVWRCWHSFAARSRQLKRLVYATLVEQQAQAAVHSAWRAWKRFVRLAIAESEQRAAQSLEGRNEQLLLESIGLKKQLRELRRRQLMQFGSTLATVVTASNAARAFDKWRRHGRLARVLQCVLDARRLRHTADAFREWRATTDALRAVAAFAQHRAAAVATALVAKAQTQKRQALWAWKAAAARQRAGKKRAVLLLMATKAGDRLVARCCLASWKALTARRREARARADNMRLRTERRMLHCCYSRWRRLRAATRCRQGGVQLLALAVGCRYRRLVARSWGHWRAHVADAVVTLAHAKLAVLELEHWNATCRHGLDQLLARAMAHWKAVATTARARRRARALAFQELQLGGLRRRCFLAWRDQLPMRRRVLHPVLCVRTSLRRHRGGRPLFCAYNEYRRKLQSGWRLSTTRAALRRRVARGCALALLLRALRRPHRRVLRRALWRWFAKAQRISSTLAAVSFRALPWRTPTTSVAGSMLLLALEELHHLQQAFGLEQRAKSLQLLELLARRFRRQHLRRALDRMRVARASRRRPERRRRAGDTATTAAARAFVARVGAALVGRAFRTWKAQYIEDALRSAEAAQLELMRALRDVASYRHALDPYAVPY